MMEKAKEAGTEMTAQQLADMEASKKPLELMLSNMTPLIASGIIGAIGCIVGAIMMRKLSKNGLIIYIVSQILPIAVSFILLGTAQFTGVTSYIMALGIPVLFIVLYITQKNQLTNK